MNTRSATKIPEEPKTCVASSLRKLHRQFVKTFLAFVFALCSVAVSSAVTFDWAAVGNPGNPADSEVMFDGTTGYGSVNNYYRISRTLVTIAQYVEFLNAVASNDIHGLYDGLLGSHSAGGIGRSGIPGSFVYEVKPNVIGVGPGVADGDDYSYSNKPIAFVSFLNAMRFANWLHNDQPIGEQDATTTEEGVYAIQDGLTEIRNPDAKYFIPSEDEWYKAAYHKNDGITGNYWDYATSADSTPNNNLPSLDTGNSANFRDRHPSTGS